MVSLKIFKQIYILYYNHFDDTLKYYSFKSSYYENTAYWDENNNPLSIKYHGLNRYYEVVIF